MKLRSGIRRRSIIIYYCARARSATRKYRREIFTRYTSIHNVRREPIERVQNFYYTGSETTRGWSRRVGYNTSWTARGKRAFQNENRLLTANGMGRETREKLFENVCAERVTLLYGCET